MPKRKKPIIIWLLCLLLNFIFLGFIVNSKIAFAEGSFYSSDEINSFLYTVFYNKKDTLRHWDSNVVGIRVFGANEDEERTMNEICNLLTAITGKQFKRYYSEDIIVEFDNYFNKQMYGDMTIGVSQDYDGKILNINRIKIDHTHPHQYQIVLHELLHAIGYKKHSLNPYSIMYPTILPSQELTEEDKQVIKMLYDPKLNLKDGMTYKEVLEILSK